MAVRDAADWLERTLKLDPARAIAHANVGDTYTTLGEPDARAAYDRYLQLHPERQLCDYGPGATSGPADRPAMNRAVGAGNAGDAPPSLGRVHVPS